MKMIRFSIHHRDMIMIYESLDNIAHTILRNFDWCILDCLFKSLLYHILMSSKMDNFEIKSKFVEII